MSGGSRDEDTETLLAELRGTMMKRGRDLLGQNVPSAPSAPPPHAKKLIERCVFELSGRCDRSTDLSSFKTVHVALPGLLSPTNRTSGIPSLMWHQVSEDRFEQTLTSLGEAHVAATASDIHDAGTDCSFTLKGMYMAYYYDLFHPRCSLIGDSLTHYASLNLLGRSTSAQAPVGDRKWTTFDNGNREVKDGVQQVINSFCSLADPDDQNGIKTTIKQHDKKQKMGYITQSLDAQSQVAHTDGGFYSSMVSRCKGTHVLFYTRGAESQLFEFDILIPEGFILFWGGAREARRRSVPNRGSCASLADIHLRDGMGRRLCSLRSRRHDQGGNVCPTRGRP